MHRWPNHQCFRKWFVAWSGPSHYLKQCRNIIKWTLRKIIQLNFNRNSYIFIQENAFVNVVWKMSAILSRPQCVNTGIDWHISIFLTSLWDLPNGLYSLQSAISLIISGGSGAKQGDDQLMTTIHASLYKATISTVGLNGILKVKPAHWKTR